MADKDMRDGAVGKRPTEPRKQLCCVYWCREPAAISVNIGETQHSACRKHAAFIKVGKLDWFDR